MREHLRFMQAGSGLRILSRLCAKTHSVDRAEQRNRPVSGCDPASFAGLVRGSIHYVNHPQPSCNSEMAIAPQEHQWV